MSTEDLSAIEPPIASPANLPSLADLPDDLLLALDSTIDGKLTGRRYSDLSADAMITWYRQYLVQLAGRWMISVGNLKRIISGHAEKRDPAIVQAEREARAARRAERAKDVA